MRGVKISLSALAVLSLALVVWMPQRARAATCVGTACNNLDPDITGCSADAYIVSSAPIYDTYAGVGQIGTVYYKWSPTCRAGYGQTVTTGGPAATISARIWGGHGGGTGRFGRNTSSVTGLLLSSGSYCDLFASGTITMGAAGSSPTGGGNSGKSCP